MESIFDFIQNARKKKLINNFYSSEVLSNVDQVWRNGDNFLFSYEDHGIKRIIFFVETFQILNEMLSCINGVYYVEFMTKETENLISSGVSIARMKRMVNADCRSVLSQDSAVLHYRNESVGELAVTSDTAAINEILWSTFRPEISHLLTDEELCRKISEGQVMIHRNEGKIKALIQANIMPKKFYINQIVNRTSKDVIHAMLLKWLAEYIEKGGKYLYAWIEEGNIASMKFHQKYGMEHDGMWSLIYRIEG